MPGRRRAASLPGLLLRDLAEHLARERLDSGHRWLGRRRDLLEVALGVRIVGPAEVDPAALELRGEVAGPRGDRVAERLDRLVFLLLGVVRHADLEPQLGLLRRRYVGGAQPRHRQRLVDVAPPSVELDQRDVAVAVTGMRGDRRDELLGLVARPLL